MPLCQLFWRRNPLLNRLQKKGTLILTCLPEDLVLIGWLGCKIDGFQWFGCVLFSSDQQNPATYDWVPVQKVMRLEDRWVPVI